MSKYAVHIVNQRKCLCKWRKPLLDIYISVLYMQKKNVNTGKSAGKDTNSGDLCHGKINWNKTYITETFSVTRRETSYSCTI